MCLHIDILNAHKPRPVPVANAGRLLILPPNHVMCEMPGGCGIFAYKRLPLVSLQAVYFSSLRSLHQPTVSSWAKSIDLWGWGSSQEVPLPL